MRPLSLKGHERALTRIRLNHDGDILFSSSKDKFICIWYVDNGERIGTYDGHSGAVWDVDVSWDTRTLVSASGDGYVKVRHFHIIKNEFKSRYYRNLYLVPKRLFVCTNAALQIYCFLDLGCGTRHMYY